jgi:hypothetical protein
VPLAAGEVFGGLLLLFLATLPLGVILLRTAERAVGHRFALSVPERVVSAFFATGGVLFAASSLPIPIYGRPLVFGLFALGSVALVGVWWREGWGSLRSGLQWIRSWPGVLLSAGTLALLAFEVLATASQLMPNTNDGSFESLYVQLILSGRTLPWTFAPYSATGIIYPAGTAVWMTLPVLMFDWPISASPVFLPTLFLSFSVVGAYCWGERLGGFGTRQGQRIGILFAGFFGLIGSWPRFFVGGSYDFAFALPLVLLVFGWLRPFVERTTPSWKEVGAFGVLVGVASALSVGIGEMIVFLFLAYLVTFNPQFRKDAGKWLGRTLAVIAIGAAFVARSLVGIAVWYGYPGHVLSPTGDPPYAPIPVGPSPLATSWSGDLDPFILKPRLSPIPILGVEIAILLAAGLILLAVWAAQPRGALRRYLPSRLVASVMVTTALTFLVTAALVGITLSPLGNSVLAEVTTAYESSFLLFICYQAIALLPLLVVVEYLRLHLVTEDQTGPQPRSSSSTNRRPRITSRWPPGVAYVVAFALIIASFGLGAGATVVYAPEYVQNHLHQLANVTDADVNALEWAGAHLPSCSRVLAAPSSAAMFLNLYANVQLVFPAFPLSVNFSYYLVVTDLTHGVYSNATRNALLQLHISEVFVTGPTSVSYPPFLAGELQASTDFSAVFAQGDAAIFLFLPGASSSGCEPI